MCCGTRGTQGCTAAGTWSACTVTGVPEVCNGADDDCDGVVDNGVTFTAGELADAGIEADGGCTVGVGVCARTAGAVCGSMGQVVCGATAGTPGTEICDELDNDCDGDVDEQLKILCLDDSDRDQYATPDAGAVPMCPDPSRPMVCPMGFVTPSGSRGLDCAPMDATLFRISDTRSDLDVDAYCSGPSRPFCTGLTAPAGRRFTSDCMGTGNDCDDQDAGVFVLADFRADVDNDNYCVGAVQQVCSGTTRPMGLKAASLCAATDDCNDNNAMQYRMASVRVDGDGDGYCTAAPAVMQCIGNSAPSGYALTCNATNDCRDTNPYATTNCNLALESPHVSKSCGGSNPTSTTAPVYVGCPQGFTSTAAYSLGNNGLITCTHVFNPGNSNINVTATCTAPISTSGECWVSVTCTAN